MVPPGVPLASKYLASKYLAIKILDSKILTGEYLTGENYGLRWAGLTLGGADHEIVFANFRGTLIYA